MTREHEEPIADEPAAAIEPAVIILSQEIFGPVDAEGQPIDKSAPLDVEGAIARHAKAEADPDEAAPEFTFVGHEAIGDSVLLHFLCPNPGPNRGAVYDLVVPESEIDSLKSQDAFNVYVQPLLAAMITPVSSPNTDKLDGWVGVALGL